MCAYKKVEAKPYGSPLLLYHKTGSKSLNRIQITINRIQMTLNQTQITLNRIQIQTKTRIHMYKEANVCL